MPAATLRLKLRSAVGDRPLYSLTSKTRNVKFQQLKNLIDGTTEPWDVRVGTAQQLVELFPFHLTIKDFYKGGSSPQTTPTRVEVNKVTPW